MKRLIGTFLMISCVFILASCNTSSEDVEDITEEFCRENPDNELCKGDYISDLQNTDVENLFFGLQEDVSEQQDICETNISLSNLELLDDCRQGDITFFPDGMDDYELVNTTTTNDTEKNIYTLRFEKDARSDAILFTITLVELDGVIYIEDWTYEIVALVLDNDAKKQLFEQMWDAYIVSDAPTSFCTEWMTDTSKEDCLSMHAILTEEGTTSEIEESSYSNELFHTVIKHHATIPVTYPVDYDLVKIGYSYYIEWSVLEPTDHYVEHFQNFVSSFNGWALTSEEVCEMYFESTKGLEECIRRRNQRMLLDETMLLEAFEWTNEDTLTFSASLRYETDQGYHIDEVTGSFYMVSGNIYFDLILPIQLSQTEQLMIFDDLVIDMNDTSMDSYTIATEYLDLQTETSFIHIRDYMLEESYLITDYNVIFGSTYFDFTLSNGDHYEFEVTWEYVEDWIMHWERIYAEDSITQLDKMLHVDGFIRGYNTSSAGIDYICDLFLDMSTSSERCMEYETMFEDGILLELIGLGFEEEYDTLEIAVYDSTMSERLGLLQYQIDFMIADNRIQMVFLDELIYFSLTETEVGVIIDGFVADLNNQMISDVDFCEEYGHLFTDCLDFRSRITTDFMFGEIADITEEDDVYTVILECYDMMLRLAYETEFELEVYHDLEENPVIMGGSIFDRIVPPDEEYLDILTAFLEAYFDDTNTVQDLFDTFNEGMEFDGLHARDYVLTQGFTYEIGDVIWHADTGWTWYEADLTFTRGDGEIIETTLHYELFPRVTEGLNFRLFYENIYPESSVIENYQTKFLIDLEDDSLVQADFCAHYFNPWDYDACLDFVSQFLSTGQDAIAGTISSTEFYAQFIVEFIAPDSSESQLLFDLNMVHDIKGQVHLLNTIKHPDTTLKDSFSNSVANGIVYGFNTHGINLDTFCAEFAECGTAFDDVTSTIQQVNYGTVYWDFEDYFNPELHALIVFHYFDGVTETHKYSGTYIIDDDGWYVWTLHFIEKAELE
jgi:hypothetical protein